MKHLCCALLALISISAVTLAFSQNEVTNKLGFGISLDLGRREYTSQYPGGISSNPLFVQIAPIAFYLPINVSERFRIEPSFALYTTSEEYKVTPSSPSSQPSSYSGDGSGVVIGTRCTYLTPLSEAISLYVGPRFDLTFQSTTFEESYVSSYPTPNTRTSYTSETSETDYAVGLVFGSEFFPVKQFSVGGEVSFNYVSYGNPEVTTTRTPPPTPSTYTTTTERSKHAFHTDALFFIRWYFLSSASATVPDSQ